MRVSAGGICRLGRQEGERWASWRSVLAGSCFALLLACSPPLPTGDAGQLGPALSEVLADGVFTCEESQARNQYNICPAEPPMVGVDGDGVSWTADELFGGLLPNPYHPGRRCYRGTSDVLGLSSYQCCYDGEELDTESGGSGSFDFVNPFRSGGTILWHIYFDIWAGSACDG